MAATDAKTCSSVLAAALLLPGLAAPTMAQQVPEKTELSFKLLDYQDRQPGLERTHVRAPSLGLVMPLGEQWGLEAGLVRDSVSGASPRWHTAVSGASRQTDRRDAGDLRLTHYGHRQSWSLGTALSDENDYRSRSLSVEHRWSTEDNNRSFQLGLGWTRDEIGATGQPSLQENRRTLETMASVTQAWTATDLVQFSLTHRRGEGYFSDPYKFPDVRPRSRHQNTALVRWNHAFDAWDAALKVSYRWYGDSFGVRAHTVEGQWVQSLGQRWTVTPGVRLYSQRAAAFYVDPRSGSEAPPSLPGAGSDGLISADQRLAGFGAVALSLKGEWMVSPGLSLDVRVEQYEQRGAWRVGGQGSPGLAPFSARHWMLGGTYKF